MEGIVHKEKVRGGVSHPFRDFLDPAKKDKLKWQDQNKKCFAAV